MAETNGGANMERNSFKYVTTGDLQMIQKAYPVGLFLRSKVS